MLIKVMWLLIMSKFWIFLILNYSLKILNPGIKFVNGINFTVQKIEDYEKKDISALISLQKLKQ